MSGKTMTRQLINVEKFTYLLVDRVSEFYHSKIDQKHIESTNLDSKILLQTKRDPNSFAIRELRIEKEKLDKKIQPHQQGNRAILDNIIDILINTKNSRRHFEIVLGTILLNYPVDKFDTKFNSRLEMSKMLRPMYQTALISLLIEKLVNNDVTFKSLYLADLLNTYSTDGEQAKADTLLELQKIFVEIIYLKEMGFYSPNSLEILDRAGENNLLDQQNRKELLKSSDISAKEFHHYGVGAVEIDNKALNLAVEKKIAVIQSKLKTGDQLSAADREKRIAELTEKELKKAERTALMKQAERFTFIKDVMDPQINTPREIEDLLQVCRVYSSFILSVKTLVDKELHIKAYDMMQKQSGEKKLNLLYTDTLLAMMGRFPIGSGIYFIDLRRHANEFGTVDKALVVGLNPRDPDEPVVKRVTTNYKYKIDPRKGVVAKEFNLFFHQARNERNFTNKLKIRFSTQFKSEDGDVHFSFRANDAFRTLAISESKLW
jgi:hypothetical protein